MRIIAHLDMDAFFAAVEERDKPRLRGLPIVVGSDPEEGRGRGIVATANYAAREYGIRSAMPIREAWRRSEAARREGKPAVAFLGGSYRRYVEVSKRIITMLAEVSPAVEQASVDEAYLDLSHLESFAVARDVCQKLKEWIHSAEGLTASIGIGPNKLIAKVASDFKKPDGLTVVYPKRVEGFLDPLSVRSIPGIGPKAEAALRAAGIVTVRDATALTEEALLDWFGVWGHSLYRKFRGLDDAPVCTAADDAKSVGEQETFRTDTLDGEFLSGRLRELAETVHRRFAADGFASYRTVVLPVRFAGFETKQRSHTLPQPAGDLVTLQFEALRLFLPFLGAGENPRRKKIRLLGIRAEKLIK